MAGVHSDMNCPLCGKRLATIHRGGTHPVCAEYGPDEENWPIHYRTFAKVETESNDVSAVELPKD